MGIQRWTNNFTSTISLKSSQNICYFGETRNPAHIGKTSSVRNQCVWLALACPIIGSMIFIIQFKVFKKYFFSPFVELVKHVLPQSTYHAFCHFVLPKKYVVGFFGSCVAYFQDFLFSTKLFWYEPCEWHFDRIWACIEVCIKNWSYWNVRYGSGQFWLFFIDSYGAATVQLKLVSIYSHLWLALTLNVLLAGSTLVVCR